MHKVRRKLERRACAAIEREGEALARLGNIRARDKTCRRKAKGALRKARRACVEAIERFDAFETAMTTLRGALECVDLATGELHRPEAVEARIEQGAGRIASLGGRECAKLAKYLRNRAPGLVLAQRSVLPQLEALGEEDGSMQAVGWACLCWSWVRALGKRPPRARHRVLSRHLLAAYGALHDRLGAEGASRLLDAVGAVLVERHRGVQCDATPLSLRAQRRHPGLSRSVPCLVQSAYPTLGTAQEDQCPRVPDRTARRRLAHPARLPALARPRMIRGACARPHVTGLLDSESSMPRRSGLSCLGKSVKKIISYLIGAEFGNDSLAIFCDALSLEEAGEAP